MEITNCVNMKSRQVCFFLYWPVENVQFCINSIGHLGWLRGTSNFPRFHNNVNSLKLWKYISAKGSPKGSFWRNTRDYQGRHNTQFFRRTLLARCVDSRSDVLETTWEDNGGNVIYFCFGLVSYQRCFLHSQPPSCAAELSFVFLLVWPLIILPFIR